MRRMVVLAILAALAMNAGIGLAPARAAIPAGDLLEALPDGHVVVVVDFQKLAGSGLWAAISAQEKLKTSIDRAQSEIGDLGLKLSDVHTIALVFPTVSMSNPVIGLNGGFEQSDLLARLRASGRVRLSSEKYKDFDVYRAEKTDEVRLAEPERTPDASKSQSTGAANPATTQKKQTCFVFHDAKTVVVGNQEAVRASIDVKTGTLAGLTKNGKLTDSIAQNPAAAIRFALTVTPAMTAGLESSQLPVPDFSTVKLIFGAIDVSSGVDLNATLRTNSAEQAKSLSERLSGLVGMAKGYLGAMNDPKIARIVEALKTININSTDVDVKIVGSVPLELLNSLLFRSATK